MAAFKLGRCLLRDLRKKKGWTQEQLAERTGLKKSNISLYENGHRKMDLLTGMIVALAIGCNVFDLYELVPKEPE